MSYADAVPAPAPLFTLNAAGLLRRDICLPANHLLGEVWRSSMKHAIAVLDELNSLNQENLEYNFEL
jgi:hypothetical protein